MARPLQLGDARHRGVCRGTAVRLIPPVLVEDPQPCPCSRCLWRHTASRAPQPLLSSCWEGFGRGIRKAGSYPKPHRPIQSK